MKPSSVSFDSVSVVHGHGENTGANVSREYLPNAIDGKMHAPWEGVIRHIAGTPRTQLEKTDKGELAWFDATHRRKTGS